MKATKPNAAPEIIYDPSSHSRKSRPGASANGRSNFMSTNRTDISHGKSMSTTSANQQDSVNEEIDINKLLKDIQYLGCSNMTWKERKKLENDRVVALGGKAPKKYRVPLSVGKFQMKKQKRTEQKRIEEEQILGRFTRHSSAPKVGKRKAEDRVLKASEGHFSKGVLNVKSLLKRKPSGGNGPLHKMSGQGKGKGKGKREGSRKGRGKGNAKGRH